MTPLFPASMKRRLFYYDYGLSRSGVAGVPVNYFICANGLFDPNITGVGHQPMGFDQMMLVYNQYTVLRSKVSLVVYNSTASVAVRAGVFLVPDTTAMTDPSRIMENGLVTTQMLSAINVTGYIKSFALNCDIPKYFGRPRGKGIVNDALLSGNAAVNPTEGVYYCLTAWDPFGVSNFSIYMDIVVEYEAVFWEPKKLTVS